MNLAVALRCVFLVLLLAAVADKIRASSQEVDDEPRTIVKALAKQGIVASNHFLPLPNDIWNSVAFTLPGCDRIVRVMPATLSLHELPLLEAVIDRDYQRHYIYLGRIWRTPDRIALRMAWFKLKVTSGLGFTSYALPKTVLLVATPPQCDVVEKIDWARVWR